MSRGQTTGASSKTYHLTKLAELLVCEMCNSNQQRFKGLLKEFSEVRFERFLTVCPLLYTVGFKERKDIKTYGDYGSSSWQFTKMIMDNEEVNFKFSFKEGNDTMLIDNSNHGILKTLDNSVASLKFTTKSSILSANFVLFACHKLEMPIPVIGQVDMKGNRSQIVTAVTLDGSNSTYDYLNNNCTLTDFGKYVYYPYEDVNYDNIVEDGFGKLDFERRWVNNSELMQFGLWRDPDMYTPDKVYLWFRRHKHLSKYQFAAIHSLPITNFKEVSQYDDTKCG